MKMYKSLLCRQFLSAKSFKLLELSIFLHTVGIETINTYIIKEMNIRHDIYKNYRATKNMLQERYYSAVCLSVNPSYSLSIRLFIWVWFLRKTIRVTSTNLSWYVVCMGHMQTWNLSCWKFGCCKIGLPMIFVESMNFLYKFWLYKREFWFC